MRFYSAATPQTATFTTGSTTDYSDALEVIYATGTMTAISADSGASGASLTTTTPFVDVLDTCNFSSNDYAI